MLVEVDDLHPCKRDRRDNAFLYRRHWLGKAVSRSIRVRKCNACLLKVPNDKINEENEKKVKR